MKKITTVALALSLAVGTFLPKQASASIIFSGEWSSGDTFLCIVLLPVCILGDEGADSGASLESLAAQGYGEEEIRAILFDQDVMTETLRSTKRTLRVLRTDTRASITADVLSIHPQATQAYVDFLLDMKGL